MVGTGKGVHCGSGFGSGNPSVQMHKGCRNGDFLTAIEVGVLEFTERVKEMGVIYDNPNPRC